MTQIHALLCLGGSFQGRSYAGTQPAPRRGLFNCADRCLSGSRRSAQLLYPPLLTGRNTLLRILGRKPVTD